MSKIVFSIFITLTILPVLVFAEEENETPDELLVGEQTVTYTEAYSITDGRLYYSGTDEDSARLVASTHDTDGDEAVDVWLLYGANEQVTTEAYDTDSDNEPDVFVALSGEEGVTAITGEGAAQFERDAATSFSPEPISASGQGADLVGDLSDITIEHKDNNWIFFVILLVAGAVLYFFWKRQK